MTDTNGPELALSGYFSSSSQSTAGSYGYWWSSTAYSSANAYFLYLDASRVYPSSSISRYYGYSVRCVLRTMQTVAEWGDTVKEGQTVTAVDERDGNTYTVRRLADGNLWMTQNLRLGGDQAITLTPNDSDVTSNYTLPASSTSGFSNNTASNVYVDATYGGYYTWCAASAGTCTSATSDGAVATGSICPKGWRLPTGGSSGEFSVLDKALGGTGSNGPRSDSYLIDESGPAFVRGGLYYGSSPYNQGTRGNYWSSTARSSTSAYYLSFYSSNVYPADIYNRNGGSSVRCVAR